MKPAEIVEGATYHGADPKNTREVVSIGWIDSHGTRWPYEVVYRPTGNRKNAGWCKVGDGCFRMTRAAFARWACGRVGGAP